MHFGAHVVAQQRQILAQVQTVPQFLRRLLSGHHRLTEAGASNQFASVFSPVAVRAVSINSNNDPRAKDIQIVGIDMLRISEAFA